jgi:hypothetical protein
MEELIAEIEAYAAARGIKPATVVQYATSLGGGAFGKWKDGSSCTLKTAQEIRGYIKAHPPSQQPVSDGS